MSKEVKIDKDINKDFIETENIAVGENENNADISKILEEMKTLKNDIQKEREELSKEKADLIKLKEGTNITAGITEEEVKKLLEEQKSIFNVSKKELEIISKEETKSTKAILDKEPKVRIKIPIDQLNKKELVVAVQLNGYPYMINRGCTVDVPETIARMLEEANYI